MRCKQRHFFAMFVCGQQAVNITIDSIDNSLHVRRWWFQPLLSCGTQKKWVQMIFLFNYCRWFFGSTCVYTECLAHPSVWLQLALPEAVALASEASSAWQFCCDPKICSDDNWIDPRQIIHWTFCLHTHFGAMIAFGSKWLDFKLGWDQVGPSSQNPPMEKGVQ